MKAIKITQRKYKLKFREGLVSVSEVGQKMQIHLLPNFPKRNDGRCFRRANQGVKLRIVILLPFVFGHNCNESGRDCRRVNRRVACLYMRVVMGVEVSLTVPRMEDRVSPGTGSDSESEMKKK